jgi:hypothetical protein
MRKLLLAFVVIGVLAGTTYAQCPFVGYIGLWADENREGWCVSGVGFYQVNMWLWCLPVELGMICAEFAISYPTNVIQSTLTWHPEIPQIILDPPSEGITPCYLDCKWDWVWVFTQQLFVFDQERTRVEIVEHPVSNDILFAVCEPGYPMEQAWKITDLLINYGPGDSECNFVAAENRSWGAIKSLVGRR